MCFRQLSEAHTSISANLRCWHTFYPVLRFSGVSHVLCTNAGFAFTAAPQQPGGERRAREQRMGPGSVTAGLGKEERKSLRCTRWCCEHTDTRVLHTAESLLSLITPSRSSWPRHQWFRGRSVDLHPPWRKRRRRLRRAHLDDLVGCPSHCLAHLPRGLPCLKVTSR